MEQCTVQYRRDRLKYVFERQNDHETHRLIDKFANGQTCSWKDIQILIRGTCTIRKIDIQRNRYRTGQTERHTRGWVDTIGNIYMHLFIYSFIYLLLRQVEKKTLFT